MRYGRMSREKYTNVMDRLQLSLHGGRTDSGRSKYLMEEESIENTHH